MKIGKTIKRILRARQRPDWCGFPYRTALAPAAGTLGAPRAFAAAHAQCRQPCLEHFLGSAVRCPWALCQLKPFVAAASCARFMYTACSPGGPRTLAMLMPVYWYAHARGTGTQLPARPRRCDLQAMPTRLRGPVAILHTYGDVGVTRSVTIYHYRASSITGPGTGGP